jgi:hypothetical protein
VELALTVHHKVRTPEIHREEGIVDLIAHGVLYIIIHTHAEGFPGWGMIEGEWREKFVKPAIGLLCLILGAGIGILLESNQRVGIVFVNLILLILDITSCTPVILRAHSYGHKREQ